jgi:hypothetical protein
LRFTVHPFVNFFGASKDRRLGPDALGFGTPRCTLPRDNAKAASVLFRSQWWKDVPGRGRLGTMRQPEGRLPDITRKAEVRPTTRLNKSQAMRLSFAVNQSFAAVGQVLVVAFEALICRSFRAGASGEARSVRPGFPWSPNLLQSEAP